MAFDLNSCNFIGRLGADPEVRSTPNGTPVASIRIACGWKTKENEGVEWIPVVYFGRQAEIVGEYLRKGSQIFVQGRFQTRKWTDKDGNDRWTSEIVGERMQMLGSKREDGGGSKPAPRQEQQSSLSDLDDSDIPF